MSTETGVAAIVAFLNARLDEEADRIVHEFDCDRFQTYHYGTRAGDCDCTATAQLVRDVEAKRALIAEIFRYERRIDGEWGCCHSAEQIAAGGCPDIQPISIEALRILAAVYGDHYEYRQEWAPEAAAAR